MTARRIFATAIVLSLIPLAGSTQTAEDVDADTRTSFDGLVQVKVRGFRNVWLKPGIDASRYDKILPGGAQFHYRDVPEPTGSTRAQRRATEFPIEERSRERLEAAVVEAFDRELEMSEHFTLTDVPGPDTVFIFGGLHDIVSRAPPDIDPNTEVYLRQVGEATLVVQIEDSMTHEVLARVIDRRAAESAFPIESNRVTNMAEARRLAAAWARSFRTSIDKWHDSEPLPPED